MGSRTWRARNLDRVAGTLGLLFAVVSALGCAARMAPAVQWRNEEARTGEEYDRATWANLERVAPGTPVSVVDRAGGMQVGSWVGASENELETRGFRKSREEVAAVAVVPEDSNWNGAAVGGGVGGILGLLGAATDEDMSAAFWGLVGLGAGALAGALIDAGVRDAERLVYAAGQPEVEPRRWRIEVTRQDLGRWLQDRRVHLMLRDGSYVEADVEGAQGSNLTVKVREVEGPFAGRGTTGIPLEEIAVSSIEKGHAVAFRPPRWAVQWVEPWPQLGSPGWWGMRAAMSPGRSVQVLPEE